MMLIKPQILEDKGDSLLLNVICPMCNGSNEIEVSKKGLDKYHKGALIQVAFPELSNDQRELLLSGICNECWDKTFKEDE